MSLPKIKEVTVLVGWNLVINWEQRGALHLINFHRWIMEKGHTRLLDPEEFRKVRVNEDGTGLVWDGISLSADRLEMIGDRLE